MATLPLLAIGAAFAETRAVPNDDEDLLTPHEQVLSRNPNRHPEWTWMTKPQAIVLLKTIGFSDILRIEKDRSFWRAMAIKDHATYHVVINRYTGLVAHMDKKSREQYPVASKVDVPTVMKPGKRKMLSTLNGPIAATISSPLKSSQPVSTVMGEVGWTWMKEKHAKLILKSKGYTNIIGLKRDAKGIWRAKAVRRGLALNAAVDNYGNVEAQPEGQGGLSQGSPSY